MAFIAAAAIVGGTALVGSYMQASAAQNAAQAYSNAANQGIDYSKSVYNNIQNLAQPYLNTGNNANTNLNNLINSGYLTSNPTMNDLTSLMPNYAFGLQQGLGQFNAGLNANGGAVSGNAIQGGETFTQNYAANALQNAFNNYQTNRQNAVSNILNANNVGMNALQTVSNAGTGTSSNVSNMLSSIGNAQAAGIMGSANAYAGALNNIGNMAFLYGMNQMNKA